MVKNRGASPLGMLLRGVLWVFLPAIWITACDNGGGGENPDLMAFTVTDEASLSAALAEIGKRDAPEGGGVHPKRRGGLYQWGLDYSRQYIQGQRDHDKK